MKLYEENLGSHYRALLSREAFCAGYALMPHMGYKILRIASANLHVFMQIMCICCCSPYEAGLNTVDMNSNP